MSNKKIIISGAGCALADFLYTDISFNSPEFKKYLSKNAGDGGLSPGKLVFKEELEKFSERFYYEIKGDIIGNIRLSSFNVGGPSIVSLIHASQLLNKDEFEVRFFGMAGKDETAENIFKILRKTPLNIDNYYVTSSKSTPFTDVLSDPDYENGHGERTFINNIGAAWEFNPDNLDTDFFNSSIVCFGGTALVPKLHDNLTTVLKRARKSKCITLVNTVYDFRNEKTNPDKPWPLVKDVLSYGLIDILIMDKDEALRISGQDTLENSATFFSKTEVSSFIITNGANNIFVWSGGSLFAKQQLIQLPVSKRVTDELRSNPELKGDTTGCGDNFTGGIIASLAWQLKTKTRGHFNLLETLSWGVASGGFSCFTIGGTYMEKSYGEKLIKVQDLQKAYLRQIRPGTYSGKQAKLVLFGAGKIGRSFIGQLFSRGGYEVVFVDVAKAIIDELNLRRSYSVIIKSDKGEEVLKIENVKGINLSDENDVIKELASAEIVAVSVGLNGIKTVIPLLAKGLMARQREGDNRPLDIIIAENMRNAEEYFSNELKKLLPENYRFNELVGLIETSIGKMVPIMQQKHIEEDILQIFAEPYNTLILNKRGFRNPIPEINGLEPKENMKAWVDRKLFIHNLGHSAAAYLGYFHNPDFVYIYEVLDVPELFSQVKIAMQQSAYILLKKYPGEFTFDGLCDHIDDLLQRFRNISLGDTIFRVGCDLKRKLGPEDRLSGAIRSAIELNLPYNKILSALVYGCYFRAKGEDGKMSLEDLEFVNHYHSDVKLILTDVCGFDKNSDWQLFLEADIIDRQIKKGH
jgi:mannitol-1-phosphate 5-dehydrogenase